MKTSTVRADAASGVARDMDGKVLSIVVPSYNMEKYIRKNLDSLVSARNIGKAEIIVVNDGSTDSTSAIAHEYAARFDGTVVVIDKPNGHYGSCINAALERARGKYFRILDADDWVDSTGLETFIDSLGNCDADLVVTHKVEVVVGGDGRQKKTCRPLLNMEYGRVYDAADFKITEHSTLSEFSMHSMTYRTQVLRDIGLSLPQGICYTDALYCFLPLDRISTIMAFDIKLYHYLVSRPGNSMSRRSMRHNMTHIVKVLRIMLDYMERHPAKSETIRSNQLRFVREASDFLLSSLRMTWHVGRGDYAQLADFVIAWKSQGVSLRQSKKYYYRHWIRTNSRHMLNLSLLVYHVFHPLK